MWGGGEGSEEVPALSLLCCAAEDQKLRLYVDRRGVATVAGHDLQG